MRWIYVKSARRRRANPLLALYRWRYELGLFAMVVALVQLGRAVHPALPVAIVLCVVVVITVVAAGATSRRRPHAFRGRPAPAAQRVPRGGADDLGRPSPGDPLECAVP